MMVYQRWIKRIAIGVLGLMIAAVVIAIAASSRTLYRLAFPVDRFEVRRNDSLRDYHRWLGSDLWYVRVAGDLQHCDLADRTGLERAQVQPGGITSGEIAYRLAGEPVAPPPPRRTTFSSEEYLEILTTKPTPTPAGPTICRPGVAVMIGRGQLAQMLSIADDLVARDEEGNAALQEQQTRMQSERNALTPRR